MSKFLDRLETTEVDDSIFEVSDHPFRYQSDLAARQFTVPVGFYTDFASVPRLGILYAMLGDRAHQPAVIHDWLYYAAITTRQMADDVLMEAMAMMGLPWYQRYPIWWGVRIGGWAAWNTHRTAGHPEVGKFADSPDILSKTNAAFAKGK
jgi:Protein of unknown function (DUF1353)